LAFRAAYPPGDSPVFVQPGLLEYSADGAWQVLYSG
jgi:hypothetical protein